MEPKTWPEPTGLWHIQKARKLPRRDVYSTGTKAASLRKLARRPSRLAPHLQIPENLEDPVGLSFHVEAQGTIKELIAVATVNRIENGRRIKKVAYIDAKDEGLVNITKALAKRTLDESHWDEVMTFMFDAAMTFTLPATLDIRRKEMSVHPFLMPLGACADDWIANLNPVLMEKHGAWFAAASEAAADLDEQHAADPSFLEAFLMEQMVMIQDVGEEIFDKLAFHKKAAADDDVFIKTTDWRRLSPNGMDLFKQLLLLCSFEEQEGGTFCALDGGTQNLLGHVASLSCVNFLRKVRRVCVLLIGCARAVLMAGARQVLQSLNAGLERGIVRLH